MQEEDTYFFKVPEKIIVASCDLNQWSLDFEGNYERIEQSILESKEKGATFRIGPELEITGYNCQDHFLEIDTINHTYEVLAKILANKNFYGILIDVGLPLIHNGVRYNCRALCFNGNLICIRPKTVLANDGIYHEERWFVAWKKKHIENWNVPDVIFSIINKATVPIGVCILQFSDVNIGMEMCEELFVPNSIHNLLALNGADIICNGNGSHFQLEKIKKRFSLVADASGKAGCAYIYNNLLGCDGSTMYFDGGSFIASCGKIVTMNKRFRLDDGCSIICAIIDVEEMRSKRGAIVSWSNTAAESEVIHKMIVHEKLCRNVESYLRKVPSSLKHHDEIVQNNSRETDELLGAPACFMWDYLRRSRSKGFFVPLSGGADSSAVCCIIYYLCHLIMETLNGSSQKDKEFVLQEIRNIVGDKNFNPTCEKDISEKILFTSYMGTENSSTTTKHNAKILSQEIGANHYDVDIGPIYKEFTKVVAATLEIDPKFASNGGSSSEDLALQNVQARSRHVLSYMLSQLIPCLGPKGQQNGDPPTPGHLLVVGTANADENARGYFTKYDCSSGDISPIGTLGKGEIKKILLFCSEKFNIPLLKEIVSTPPSAELIPLVNGISMQTDEADMGFTFEELGRMRELRNLSLCGPLSMFYKLLEEWRSKDNAVDTQYLYLSPQQIAEKVKKFFITYGNNRHKSAILPPCVHLSSTSVDGRQFDMRPILYNSMWKWQFRCIDIYLKREEKKFSSAS